MNSLNTLTLAGTFTLFMAGTGAAECRGASYDRSGDYMRGTVHSYSLPSAEERCERRLAEFASQEFTKGAARVEGSLQCGQGKPVQYTIINRGSTPNFTGC